MHSSPPHLSCHKREEHRLCQNKNVSSLQYVDYHSAVDCRRQQSTNNNLRKRISVSTVRLCLWVNSATPAREWNVFMASAGPYTTTQKLETVSTNLCTQNFLINRLNMSFLTLSTNRNFGIRCTNVPVCTPDLYHRNQRKGTLVTWRIVWHELERFCKLVWNNLKHISM